MFTFFQPMQGTSINADTLRSLADAKFLMMTPCPNYVRDNHAAILLLFRHSK